MNFGYFFFFVIHNMIVLPACQYENFVLGKLQSRVIRVSGVNGLLVFIRQVAGEARAAGGSGRRFALHGRCAQARARTPAAAEPAAPAAPQHRSARSVIRRRSRWCHFFQRVHPHFPFIPGFIFDYSSGSVQPIFCFYIETFISLVLVLFTQYLELRRLCNQLISAASVTQSTNGHYGEIPQVCPSDKTTRLSERRMTHIL